MHFFKEGAPQYVFRYRDRFFFPGPIFSGTGTIQKGAKFPGPGCHTLASLYDAVSDVVESGVRWRSDFQIGSSLELLEC